MARARNIKPGFFKNEQLPELSALTRLFFIGTWTIADREGRFEDRPKRVMAEILPYDEGDAEEMIDSLCRIGMLYRYEVNGVRLIQVVNFSKHQAPHHKEQESTLPAPPSAPLLPECCTDLVQGKHGASTDLTPELPSSCRSDSLIPDSLIPSQHRKPLTDDADAPPLREQKDDDGFNELWQAYPKREGGNPRPKALSAYRARIKAGVPHAELLAGVRRYALYCHATGNTGTRFVKQAASFLGAEGEAWRESWAVNDSTGHRTTQSEKFDPVAFVNRNRTSAATNGKENGHDDGATVIDGIAERVA